MKRRKFLQIIGCGLIAPLPALAGASPKAPPQVWLIGTCEDEHPDLRRKFTITTFWYEDGREHQCITAFGNMGGDVKHMTEVMNWIFEREGRAFRVSEFQVRESFGVWL